MFPLHTKKQIVPLVAVIMLIAGVTTLLAQERSTEPYGCQDLGKETTVKQSLVDPKFKLRKLKKDHYLDRV